MRPPLVVVAMVVISTVGLVRADDWPEFRGPTGQGYAKGSFATEWGPDKNIAWKQKIPGGGWSSPVVYKGRVYLTSAVTVDNPNDKDTKDQSLRALCLDAKTGKILWNEEVILQPGDKVTRNWVKNGNASPTPIVDGQRLFVHFSHLGTACLDLDGKVLWRNTDFHHKPKYGNGGSPILVDDLLVFSIDEAALQCVIALEQATGKARWQTERSVKAKSQGNWVAGSSSTPLLIDVKGRRQIISPGNNMVGAYDPKTGKEIWRMRCVGNAVVPRPVFGHGMVFVSIGMGSDNLYAIRADGEGDVTDTHVAWKKRDDHRVPSLLLVGDELYAVTDNGRACCLDAKTGKLHWSERFGGTFYASPLLADDKIYFQGNQGEAVVVKVGTKFEQIARNSMNEQSHASYAAIDGAIFLRTAEHLYRIENRP